MAFYHLQIGALVGQQFGSRPNPALAFLLLGSDCRADPTGESSDKGQRDASNFRDALPRIRRRAVKGVTLTLIAARIQPEWKLSMAVGLHFNVTDVRGPSFRARSSSRIPCSGWE